MPRLNVTRTYADNQSPVQSDIDAIVDDIEILVNTILLDDDNFQDEGIDASLKLQDETIEANQIRNNNITTAKLSDGAVTNSKIESQAITTAKIVDSAVSQIKTNPVAGFLPAGAVEMFHSYGGAVSYPRGWMLCNGNVVNEANYDAIHGAGAYDADSVAASPLNNKTLPDMDNRYAVGVSATVKDGSIEITAVGNEDHQIDLSHTHTSNHRHTIGAGGNAEIINGEIWANSEDGIMRTEYVEETSNSSLSSAQSIKPESHEFMFIIRVV